MYWKVISEEDCIDWVTEYEILAGLSILPFQGNTGKDNIFGLVSAEMTLSSRYPCGCLVDSYRDKCGAGKRVWNGATDMWLRNADKIISLAVTLLMSFFSSAIVRYMNILIKRRKYRTYPFSQQKAQSSYLFLKLAYKIMKHFLNHRDSTEKNGLIYD